MRGRNDGVVRNAAEYVAQHGRFCFSIITRYEVLRGLKAKGAERQAQQFEDQCRESDVLPLSDPIVVRAAEIYAALKRAGRLITDGDILIGATAVVHGLILVTENGDHFRRIPGLAVESWRST